MDRRNSIKALIVGSLSTGVLVEACKPEEKKEIMKNPESTFSGINRMKEEQEHYKEGTLIIDLIDTRTRKIVWRGFGVGEVHNNPQKTIDDLPKVVNGVLDQLQLTPGYSRQIGYSRQMM